MTGIIIAGHGNFASGIVSALELLAGQQEFLKAVDFESTHSEEQLKDNLTKAFEALSQCDRFIVLCDLLGGSPFKMAVRLSFGNDRVSVLYGMNLGMAVELTIRCMTNSDKDSDLKTLADEIVVTGQGQIGRYEFVPVLEEENDEGI